MAAKRRKSVNVKAVRVSEDDIQKSVAAHLSARSGPWCYWFHVPNGGSRNVIEAAKLKRMGVRAGVADIVLLIDGKSYFLELKARKGRVSPDQKAAQSLVERAGGTYAVAWGIDEALATLETWGAFTTRKPVILQRAA